MPDTIPFSARFLFMLLSMLSMVLPGWSLTKLPFFDDPSDDGTMEQSCRLSTTLGCPHVLATEEQQ